jgi:hypothetical protein
MNCPACGTQNMDNSFQCYKCGAKLPRGATDGGAQAQMSNAPPAPPAQPAVFGGAERFSLERNDAAPAATPSTAAAPAPAASVSVVGGIPVVTPGAAPSAPVINPTPETGAGSAAIAATAAAVSAVAPASAPASPYGSAPVLNAPGGPLYGSGTVGGTGSAVDPQSFANKIAGYEYLSGIFWIVLGIIQCLTCVGAIAGAWNIYAATRRFKLAKAIRALDPGVPAAFQDAGPLIVMAAVNLILGGVIGVVFVAFDAYIRSQVLKNAHVFRG